MNRLLAVLFIVAIASCTPPVETVIVTPTAPNVHVLDSAWLIVAEATVTARDLDTESALAAEVAAYNAAHTDDQWRIVYGDVPPIEAAPSADAYIVEADTHAILEEYHGIDRADLTARRDQWRTQTASHGDAVLYVDNIPAPPVVVIDTREPYEKYALYLVSSTGAIIYEEHLETEADFRFRLQIFDIQARADGNGEYVISGRIYTEAGA